MKTHKIGIGLLAVCLTFSASASYSPPSTLAYAAALSSSSGTDISDGRKVTILGLPCYTKSTDGYIRVTNTYYASGDLNNIPIAEVVAVSSRSYTFEASSSGAATGLTVSGSGTSLTLTPTYRVFYDNQADMRFGGNGAFFNRGTTDGTSVYVCWYRHVPIAIYPAIVVSYITAEHGQPLYASGASIGDWETIFACSSGGSIAQRMAGRLESGDSIALHSNDASVEGNWIASEHGALDYAVADRDEAGDWEHYTIAKVSGSGTIGNNQSLTLLDHDSSSPRYWLVDYGTYPSGIVKATGTGGVSDVYEWFRIVRL